MDQIFDPFRDGDLLGIKDRIRKRIEGTAAISAQKSSDSIAVMTVKNKIQRSAMRTAAHIDRIDQFDLFLAGDPVFGIIPLMDSG